MVFAPPFSELVQAFQILVKVQHIATSKFSDSQEVPVWDPYHLSSAVYISSVWKREGPFPCPFLCPLLRFLVDETKRRDQMTFLPVAARDGGRKSRRQYRSPLLPKHGEDYDGAAGEAAFSGAVFNLSTTIVGAGIMALPAAVKVLGLVPGLAAILLVAALTEASADMLLRAGRNDFSPKVASSNSYAAVVDEAFGGAGRVLLQFCVVVNNLGVLVVYMIIIGDVLSGTTDAGTAHHVGVIEGWFGRHWWTERAFLLLLTTVLVFAPLIFLKRVDSLRYTSALSMALAVVFVVVTAGITVVKVIDGSVGIPRLFPAVTDQASFWKLFTTVPVLVTAYICHYSIHPIENELKDPSQMKSIVRTSVGLCSAVYVATSFFGFLLFGEGTQDDVLANFDVDLGYGYALNDVVRVSYAAHLMLVFPIVFYSLRLNLDGLLFPVAVPIVYDARRFFVVTVALMASVFVGANFVPSIWDAFQLTGATAAVAIGFIFPAAITLRNVHGMATRKDKALAWVMILLAVSSSTVAICSDVYDMFMHRSRS